MHYQNVRGFVSLSTAALLHAKYASVETCPGSICSGIGRQTDSAWRCEIHSVLSGVETVLQYCIAQHLSTRVLHFAPQKNAIWISSSFTFPMQRTNAMPWHPKFLLWLSVQGLIKNWYETKKPYKINSESGAHISEVIDVNSFEGVVSSQLSVILTL